MITLHEEIVSLNDARSIVPRVGTRCRPDLSTIYRWAMRGIGGIKLETIKVGGVLCTSREALERFFNRDEPVSSPAHKSLGRRSTDITAIEQRLKSKGA